MAYLFLTLALVALDQAVKHLVMTCIPLHGSIPLLPHVVELTYVQNTGAAFSMLEGHTWLLTLCSLVMSVVLALAVWRKFFAHPLGRAALTLVLAGAVGNLIDRCFRGFVVDMFRTLFVDFPVFNVADICVVAGGIAAGLYYLFLYDRLEKKKELPHEPADAEG